MRRDLPVTVIGGYLGAGKTTLVNRLLAQAHGLRLAVLVNDFGAVNIDASLIANHDGDTISLANGCICCDLTNGFATAISGLLKQAGNLDHVVIEASGVGEPGKIATYGQMFGLPLDGVMVMVDAEQIGAQAVNKYVGDTVLRQLRQADLLILNKRDLLAGEALADRRDWLAMMAPDTPVFETEFAEVPVEILLGRGGSKRPMPTGNDHGHGHRTWVLERRRPVARAALDRLADRLGKRVFRAKGFVDLAEAPGQRHLFQLVGPRWTLTRHGDWGNDQPRTRLVIIGPDAGAMAARKPAAA